MNMWQLYKRVRKDMIRAELEAGSEILWSGARVIHLIQKYTGSRDKALACYMMYIGKPIHTVLKRRKERKQLRFDFMIGE